MPPKKWLRLLAMLSVFSLAAAACADDDTAAPDTTVDDEVSADGLVIGAVLPETGPLAFLGPPQIEGVNLAIKDINEAGGVLGSDVTLLGGDEGADATAALEAATRLVNEGAHAIIGAAASGSSQEFIQLLSDEQIPQCSASNTSPAFSDQENADFYFRTVPPDEAVAPIIADTVIGDGAGDSVVIVARADDYGNALAELVKGSLSESGSQVEVVNYDPEAGTFDAEVQSVLSASPTAVVLIAFDEGGQIVAGLLEGGITADQIYGGDGVFSPTFVDQVDPSNPNVIDGMKVIGAAGGEDFNARIADAVEGNFIYGGQAYDCAIVIALAAEAAGSTDGQAIIDEIQDVTTDGTECDSFAGCKELLEAGEDIDYNGASGPLNLDDVGDPTFGRYAIGQFVDGTFEIIDSQDVDLSKVG